MPLPNIDLEYLKRQLGKLLSIPSPTGYTDTVVRYYGPALQAIVEG